MLQTWLPFWVETAPTRKKSLAHIRIRRLGYNYHALILGNRRDARNKFRV